MQGKRRKEKGFRTIDEEDLNDLIKKKSKGTSYKLLTIGLLIVLADQLSKTVVVRCLHIGESTPVLGDFFKLTLILNPGGVFGSKVGSQSFYTIVSVLALVVTSWFFFKAKSSETWLRVGLCMVMGGAIGNLVDRLRFGQVVDFLDFDFFNINLPPSKVLAFDFPGFYLDRWPVFNLADSAVLIGIVFIVVHLLKSQKSAAQSPPI